MTADPATSGAFVGARRHRLLDRLEDHYERAVRDRRPRLVVLSGPTGAGKTRVVQEFYRRLAAAQPEPPYWPPAIVDEASLLAEGTRNRTWPDRVTVAAGHQIPWLWLGIDCGALDGRPREALFAARGQFRQHAEPILHRAERRAAVRNDLSRLAPLVFGRIWEIGSLIVDGKQGGSVLRDLVGHLRDSMPDVDRTIDLGDAQAEEVAGFLDGLAFVLQDLPLILVVDDAHDADATTLEFLDQLLHRPLPALIIATAWPERLDAPADVPRSFAAWLEGVTADLPGRVSRVGFDPLPTTELARLVTQVAPRTSDAVAHRLADRADGNPYALVLLLASARVRRATRDGRIELSQERIDELPGSVWDNLRSRWNELAEDARTLLTIAAVQGPTCALDVATRAAADVDASFDPADSVEEAVSRLWLRSFGAQLPNPLEDPLWVPLPDQLPGQLASFFEAPRFDLAQREYEDLWDPDDKARLLRMTLDGVTQLLAADGAGAPRLPAEVRRQFLGLHWKLAAQGVDADLAAAADSCLELGEHLVRQRDPAAVACLTSAADWAAPATDTRSDDRRGRARAALGMALVLDGEPARALEVLGVDHHLDDHPAHTTARGRALLAVGRVPDALMELRSLVHRCEQRPEQRRALVQARHELAVALNAGDQTQRAAALRLRADVVEDCRQLYGDGLETQRAMINLAVSLNASGRAEDRQRSMQLREEVLAIRRARFEPGHPLVASSCLALANSHLRAGDPVTAEALAEQGVQIRTAAYGPDHLDTVFARSIRARCWRQLGVRREDPARLERARDEFAHVLAVRLRRLPRSHRRVMDAREGLARTQRAIGGDACDTAVQVLLEGLADEDPDAGYPEERRTRLRLLLHCLTELGRDEQAGTLRDLHWR